MTIKKFHGITAIILTAVFILGTNGFAGGIKERMKARLPQINALKAEGSIGENNRGYLDFMSTQKPQAKLVASENKDRETVYKVIAKKKGSTTENVGRRRAIKIYATAKPGHWLQDDKGSWYQK